MNTVPSAGRCHPVDDTAFTRPLARALQGHALRMAPPGGGRGEDAVRTEAAMAWVYMSVLVAWAEDHGLTRPWLREGAAVRREAYLASPAGGGARGWLALATHDLARHHPATWCLLDPRYTALRDAEPPEEACRDLLHWWAAEAPSLAYEAGEGPASVTGWLAGDLLGWLSEARRKDHALVQTPWWVCDFILDRTLRAAAAEFPQEAVPGGVLRVVDPTCGTGHFLTRAATRLWELYTTGDMASYTPGAEPVTGWEPAGPAEAARRILAGVHGVELDPLTAATARLRLTTTVAARMVEAGVWPAPLRLARIPHTFRPHVVVGDSLLMGRVPFGEYRRLRPLQAGVYTSEEALFGSCAWPAGGGGPAAGHAV